MYTAWNSKRVIEIVAILALIGGGYWYFTSPDATSGELPSANGVVPGGGVAAVPPDGTEALPVPVGVSAIVIDPANGQEFLSNQIIVGFKLDATTDDVLEVLKSVDGVMLQRFTNVPLLLVSVPDQGDGKTALAAVEKLKRDRRVETAEPNYVTTLSGVEGVAPVKSESAPVNENAAPEEGAAE